MKQSYKTIALWLALLLLFISVFNVFKGQKEKQIEVPFSTFVTDLESKKIAEVTFKGDQKIVGKYKPNFSEGRYFKTIGTTGDAAFKLVRDNGLTPNYEESEKTPLWQQLLINWGPMIFLFILFFMFMRQLQSGGGKAMSFGKSRARLLNEGKMKITFKDVAGVDEAKEELREFVDFLKDPKKYTRLGGRIPKGVLLVGAPGTGKTLLAKAISGEAGVPFFSISGSDFVEMFVGVGASRVRDLFDQGKKSAPCIIFIDEIDAVGRHRGAGLGGGHDEREQTLNQLLVEMDGFESNEGVILIAATNRPDVLDPALLRPGRFDRTIIVNRPDVNGRKRILEVHSSKMPLSDDVNLEVVAKATPGFTGADLENLVNEAALLAARGGSKSVTMHDIEGAKDKVIMGVARHSMIISEEEKHITAVHEAGHTLLAKLIKEADPVHKVTIIPHGLAMGVTQTLPEDDRYLLKKEKALAEIEVLMGGRVAEELIIGSKTSGASNDLERASDIARKMVCNWGMSDKMGPLKWGNEHDQIFLGKEFGTVKNYSEETAKTIDDEIRNIVMSCYNEAKDLILKNKDKLSRISEALLEREVLSGDEVDILIEGKILPPKVEYQRPQNEMTDEKKEEVKTDAGLSHQTA
ncbi:MAG: ATP-dependent zinc metalloprotease FtsH [Proteobacteria bacterium]|nr:ATP-dependent zinc metalloprotease FtsH [Pseudomonadota bacterium]